MLRCWNPRAPTCRLMDRRAAKGARPIGVCAPGGRGAPLDAPDPFARPWAPS